MIRFFALFLLFITAAHITPVYAQNDSAIGTVLLMEGTATVERHGNYAKQIKVDQPVFINDVIETNAESKLLILFIDDTQFTLGAKARMAIDEYIFDNTKESKARFSVMRGAFVFVSGLMTKIKKPDVEIHTAYGSAGIRGTKLWCGELEQRNFGVFVEEGLVTFKTEKGQTEISPGFGTQITSIEDNPTAPQKWDAEMIDSAFAKTTLRDSDRIKERMAGHAERHQRLRESHIENLKHRKPSKRPANKTRKIQPDWE